MSEHNSETAEARKATNSMNTCQPGQKHRDQTTLQIGFTVRFVKTIHDPAERRQRLAQAYAFFEVRETSPTTFRQPSDIQSNEVKERLVDGDGSMQWNESK